LDGSVFYSPAVRFLKDVNKTGPEALPVSVFLTLHKSWDKIQPTENIKLNQKVKQTSLRFFLYM